MCRLIRDEGLSDTAAGSLAGISKSALSRWKQEDEDFALDLDAARAQFDLQRLREVREARRPDGTSDWRGSAWLLEHGSSEGYGRQRRDPAATRREIERIVDERLRAASLSPAAPPVEPSAPATESRPDDAGAATQNCANRPEIPEIPAREADVLEPVPRAGDATAPSPATPSASPSTADRPRLSRRERRAEERRLAKEATRQQQPKV